MKTIGLIGGMSSESTAIYYRILNATVKEALGGQVRLPAVHAVTGAAVTQVEQQLAVPGIGGGGNGHLRPALRGGGVAGQQKDHRAPGAFQGGFQPAGQ